MLKVQVLKRLLLQLSWKNNDNAVDQLVRVIQIQNNERGVDFVRS